MIEQFHGLACLLPAGVSQCVSTSCGQVPARSSPVCLHLRTCHSKQLVLCTAQVCSAHWWKYAQVWEWPLFQLVPNFSGFEAKLLRCFIEISHNNYDASTRIDPKSCMLLLYIFSHDRQRHVVVPGENPTWPYFEPDDKSSNVVLISNEFSGTLFMFNLEVAFSTSMKKGQIVSVTKEMPSNGVFHAYRDIKKYWKNMVSTRVLLNF